MDLDYGEREIDSRELLDAPKIEAPVPDRLNALRISGHAHARLRQRLPDAHWARNLRATQQHIIDQWSRATFERPQWLQSNVEHPNSLYVPLTKKATAYAIMVPVGKNYVVSTFITR